MICYVRNPYMGYMFCFGGDPHLGYLHDSHLSVTLHGLYDLYLLETFLNLYILTFDLVEDSMWVHLHLISVFIEDSYGLAYGI